jgi:predicted transcriptional regulator
MARQGYALSEQEVRKILQLLSTTDMSIGDIAKRMGCSHSVVVSINRKFKVRQYAGLRNKWTLIQSS